MPGSPHIALFPGTFDPITNGHLDVIRRGLALFDRLIVAVARNPEKRVLFSQEERCEMIRSLAPGVNDAGAGAFEVTQYSGLTVDYAREVGATAILRGLRNVTDLHFEFQLALTNRAIADIETVFIMTDEVHGFTSSSLIRQIAAGGAIDRLSRLLPPLVVDRLKQKKEELGGLGHLIRVDGMRD